MTLLWGDLGSGKLSGSLVKLPQGTSTVLTTYGGDMKSVVTQGEIAHSVSSITETSMISAGGYFASANGVPHSLSCTAESACIIYVRTKGKFQIEEK